MPPKEENVLLHPQVISESYSNTGSQSREEVLFSSAPRGHPVFSHHPLLGPEIRCSPRKMEGSTNLLLSLKNIPIPGFPSGFFILYQLQDTNPQSTNSEGQFLHCLNWGPRNILSQCIEDSTLLLPQAQKQITQDWYRSWLFFFLHLNTFYKYTFVFCFPF